MPEIDFSTATRGKVLVVEDVALIRLAAVDMVEQLGFPVAEAHDGEAALALIESDPDIRILFTDLGLPGMHGSELVAKARRLRPDLKVVIASGYAREAGDQAEDGIVQLVKPYDLNQLRLALGA
jgi:CheY-like chemotaxis protein